MKDIFDQDLRGPVHENPEDCKAPAMSTAMWDIIQKANAGDTCVFTAIVNTLAHAYDERFAKRGVSPENFLEEVANNFVLKEALRDMSSLLERLCQPDREHMH